MFMLNLYHQWLSPTTKIEAEIESHITYPFIINILIF